MDGIELLKGHPSTLRRGPAGRRFPAAAAGQAGPEPGGSRPKACRALHRSLFCPGAPCAGGRPPWPARGADRAALPPCSSLQQQPAVGGCPSPSALSRLPNPQVRASLTARGARRQPSGLASQRRRNSGPDRLPGPAADLCSRGPPSFFYGDACRMNSRRTTASLPTLPVSPVVPGRSVAASGLAYAPPSAGGEAAEGLPAPFEPQSEPSEDRRSREAQPRRPDGASP